MIIHIFKDVWSFFNNSNICTCIYVAFVCGEITHQHRQSIIRYNAYFQNCYFIMSNLIVQNTKECSHNSAVYSYCFNLP